MRAPEFWYRTDAPSQLIATALTPLGWLYGSSVARKAAAANPYRSKAKVICVGNLTVGGTGKTPVAIAIADILAGRKFCFLTRGYGGQTAGPVLITSQLAVHVGDEALLLSKSGPTIVAKDRGAGGRLADEHGFEIIIMDDGHQNFTLAKDLSLVVIDAESGFGNGRVLPAGPLREPIAQGLGRADAVIAVGEGVLPDLQLPVIRARLESQIPAEVGNERVLAFAGIGRPEKFFGALAKLGITLANTQSFADHHFYSPSEIAGLKAKAKSLTARLVTTEKDFIRLTQAEREGITPIPVRATFSDSAALRRLLDRLVPAL